MTDKNRWKAWLIRLFVAHYLSTYLTKGVVVFYDIIVVVVRLSNFPNWAVYQQQSLCQLAHLHRWLCKDLKIKKVKVAQGWYEYQESKSVRLMIWTYQEVVSARISESRKWECPCKYLNLEKVKGAQWEFDVKKVKFFWSGDDFAHLGGLRGFLVFF